MTKIPASDVEVHVVIVNYHSADLAAACIESLAVEEIASLTVLDNASGGAESDLLEQALSNSPHNSRLLVSVTNLGFGAGVNKAVASIPAKANDLLWILNPDTTVPQGTVSQMRKEMIEGGFDLLSPVILKGEQGSSAVWFAGGLYDARVGRVRHYLQGEHLSSLKAEMPFTNFLTGAALLIRVSAWKKLEGFRTDLFLYWEDVDLSVRAAQAGLALGMASQATIWHQVGGSGGGAGRSSAYYFFMARNRFLIAGKSWDGDRRSLGRFVETTRLLLRPLKEHGLGKLKLIHSVRGTRAGLKAMKRSRERGTDGE